MNEKQSKNFVELNESQPNDQQITDDISGERQQQYRVEQNPNQKQIKEDRTFQNLKEQRDIEIALEQEDREQNEIRQRGESFSHFVHRNEFPTKAAVLAVIFTLIGGFLITAGFIPMVRDWDPFHGFLLWGAGLVLLIPGMFYIVKIYQAYRARDEGDRQELLNEIPEL